MKKLIILAAVAFSTTFAFAQHTDRSSVEDHDVRKGFYGNLNINSLSPFDQTYNFGVGGGMHFSEQFHIGLSYFGGKGSTSRLFSDSVSDLGINADLKYRSFGIELGYEVPLHEHFSIMPYFNQSFVKYTYEGNSLFLPEIGMNLEDNFLNTQIGAKLFFVANENIKIGANIGYGLANGVNLYNTEASNLSGLNAGITLQYNYFLPKW
ncbi:MAG: hypothetical protein N4A35_08925 [Flavobacteriales bacterium]|jgi:hypothetical protein|nr:hypothetical protein [Flavobacteriales bacterium]